MKKAWVLLSLCCWLILASGLPALAQPDPLVTPGSQPTEPHQSVADLFGGGIALYRALPENRLQVVDFDKQSSNEFFVSSAEVSQLQEAYLQACATAASIAEGEARGEVSVKLRTHEVTFVPIRMDGRSWVVLNVLGLEEKPYRTFVAVP